MSAEQPSVPSSFEIWQRVPLPEAIGTLDIFRYPKDLQRPDQYEDASATRLFDQSTRQEMLALAVADGASEAVLSGAWSRVLVETYTNRPPREGKSGLRSRWWHNAQAAFKEALDVSKLPWYAVEKLANGSHATFGGVAIFLSDRQFSIAGYGDVIIALACKDELTIYPESLREVEAFGNRPSLVSTLEPPTEEGNLQKRHWLPRDGCTFLLMTDALGAWFVAESTQSAADAVDRLNSIEDAASFQSFVETHRSNRTMRTDDVTLARLCLFPR